MQRVVAALAVLIALAVAGGSGWVIYDTHGRVGRQAKVAALSEISNTVQWRRAGATAWRSADRGLPLFDRDMVKTGDASRAILAFVNGIEVVVDPGSVVSIAPAAVTKDGRPVQTLVLESGGFSGRIGASPLVRGAVVDLVEKTGAVRASIAAARTATTPVRYRVRRTKAGTEVAILSGNGVVGGAKGSGAVRVAAGQMALVAGSGAKPPAVKPLPGAPTSIAPAVDARVDLSKAGAPVVPLSWAAIDGAKSYHVELGQGADLGRLAVNEDVAKPAYDFKVSQPDTWYWRVATVDAAGLEGAFGPVRRFTVVALPGQKKKPARPAAAAPTSAAEVTPLPPVPGRTHFSLPARVVGRGLARQALGKGAFAPLRGRVKLAGTDVVEAKRGAGLNLGPGALLALEKGSQVSLERAGVAKGRHLLELSLSSGAMSADLSRSSTFGTIYLDAAGTRIAVSSAGGGGRARVEHTGGQLRVVSERGVTSVWTQAKQVKVPSGHAVVVADGGPPSNLIALPSAPPMVEPRDGARFPTLGSPPAIEFRWHGVEGASSYLVRISTDREGTAVVYEGTANDTRLIDNALMPGAYFWTVRAVDPRGFEGPSGPARRIRVTRDRTPPKVTVTSPANGATLTGSTVDVRGETEVGARVRVDGKAVDVDDDGGFETSVPLEPGPNRISIQATDGSGNVSRKSVTVQGPAAK